MFYQSGAAVRGYASVAQVDEANDNDRVEMLSRNGLHEVVTRIGLVDTHEFTKPICVAPLVDQLDFVKNKRYWGHSVRTFPRIINELDLNIYKSAYLSTVSVCRSE